MSVHRFSRQVRYTLCIESGEQLIEAQRFITNFLRILHFTFVACGCSHRAFLTVLRDSVGIEASSYLAAALSNDKNGQGRLTVAWPDDERNNADYRRLVDVVNAAITDLSFSQKILPVQNCGRAIELFLRDLMEACEGADEASSLAYFVIGDEAAFHLACLLPEARRAAVLAELDFFSERLELFKRLVQGWINENKQARDDKTSSRATN